MIAVGHLHRTPQGEATIVQVGEAKVLVVTPHLSDCPYVVWKRTPGTERLYAASMHSDLKRALKEMTKP